VGLTEAYDRDWPAFDERLLSSHPPARLNRYPCGLRTR